MYLNEPGTYPERVKCQKSYSLPPSHSRALNHRLRLVLALQKPISPTGMRFSLNRTEINSFSGARGEIPAFGAYPQLQHVY
jgi:hypothetical protein